MYITITRKMNRGMMIMKSESEIRNLKNKRSLHLIEELLTYMTTARKMYRGMIEK